MTYDIVEMLMTQEARYNIPVNIWLTENYPHGAPIVYVTPTPGMVIKPDHTFVDSSGAVHSPYLKNWDMNFSNLVDLAFDMGIQFGEEPPLFSKPPGMLIYGICFKMDPAIKPHHYYFMLKPIYILVGVRKLTSVCRLMLGVSNKLDCADIVFLLFNTPF